MKALKVQGFFDLTVRATKPIYKASNGNSDDIIRAIRICFFFKLRGKSFEFF
jgi:hypothetical protein